MKDAESAAATTDAGALQREAAADRGRAQDLAGQEQRTESLEGRFLRDLGVEQGTDPDRERFEVKPDTGIQDHDDLERGRVATTAKEDRQGRDSTAAQREASRTEGAAANRADVSAMQSHGVPPGAQEARVRTAPAFGRTTAEGLQQQGVGKAVKPATTKRSADRIPERGR